MNAVASLSESARKIALDRFRLLQPHLEEQRLLKAVARDAGIEYRTAQRWKMHAMTVPIVAGGERLLSNLRRFSKLWRCKSHRCR
jgi:creatinine amidohydrolase/Fe(II)-dependent formamide hydrolase-like protein